MLSQLVVLLYVAGALSSPTTSQYRYFHGIDEIQNLNHSRPVHFNGVAIGTNELDSEALNGTIHALADGHHFGQRGWYLSGTNGGSWEYLPELRSLMKRASCGSLPAGEYRVCSLISASTTVSCLGALAARGASDSCTRFSVETLSNGALGAATEFAWDVTSALTATDLFDGSSFVTSSTALIGDLSSIFFNALEFFA
jgi:hypothetical protein